MVPQIMAIAQLKKSLFWCHPRGSPATMTSFGNTDSAFESVSSPDSRMIMSSESRQIKQHDSFSQRPHMYPEVPNISVNVEFNAELEISPIVSQCFSPSVGQPMDFTEQQFLKSGAMVNRGFCCESNLQRHDDESGPFDASMQHNVRAREKTRLESRDSCYRSDSAYGHGFCAHSEDSGQRHSFCK